MGEKTEIKNDPEEILAEKVVDMVEDEIFQCLKFEALLEILGFSLIPTEDKIKETKESQK
jgi:hypothetical protein